MRVETTSGDDKGSIRLKVQFDAKSLRLKESPFGLLVQLDECLTSGEPGGPALPAKTVRIALPAFTRATSADAKGGDPEIVRQEAVMIAPVQFPRPGVPKSNEDDCKDDEGGHERDPRIKRSSLRAHDEPLAEPLPTPPFVAPNADLYKRAADAQLVDLITTELQGITPVAVVLVKPLQITSKG